MTWKKKRGVQKIGNLNLRPRRIEKAEFLSLVSGRDTADFRRAFAKWLANQCQVDLVRLCFDEQPKQEIERLRQEIYPAAFLRLRHRAHKERNPATRRNLQRKMDREWPAERLQQFTEQLRIRSNTFRDEYETRLINELSGRSPVDQIPFLNRHLKQNRLLPPILPSSSYAPVPAMRKSLTNRPPRFISLSEIQDAYYEDNPQLTHHESEWKRLMREEEFGRALAKRMARSNIPGEAQALEEIGQALAVFPHLGENPKPVWVALCACQKEIGTGDKKRVVRAIPLRKLLKEGFQFSPERLRRFAATALLEHLQMLDSIHLGRFRALMRMGRNIHAQIKQLAGNNREVARCYRQIHRAARYDPRVVSALQEFFFHGLPIKELRTRPALVVKLMPAFKKDVSLLGRFLFTKKSKGKLGFVPKAVEIDKPGSLFQRKLVMHQTWPERVRLKREGKKDAELAALVDKLAGVPLEVIGKSGYSAAAERLRERQGLTYPR